jgi:hypothetical protein
MEISIIDIFILLFRYSIIKLCYRENKLWKIYEFALYKQKHFISRSKKVIFTYIKRKMLNSVPSTLVKYINKKIMF